MRKLGTTAPASRTLAEWIIELDDQGVEKVVFAGRQSANTGSNDVTNEYVSEAAHRYPGRIVGLAGINPSGGMSSVREVGRAINELKLSGIALDPFGGSMAPNDRRLYPIYSKCAELEVPVVVTTGPLPFAGARLAHGSVVTLDDVACDFPELTIVVDHTGWPWVNEAIALAFRHENVYIDTSFYMHLPGCEQFAHAANSIIPDKLIFASGYPVVPIAKAYADLSALPFTPEALEAVRYGNAKRLLNKFGC
ncbi:hypothetical protein SAMN04488135_11419 [Pollutimonas bauzanensis]|uniref:Amidohydrolase-related domain-containing protein n=2 Tax=Pollutimonas bauzanensis TaxID=658167 RepID=A0A1M5ZE55_9BURK|nr:hypothetical protein SAMN04488135_11419 [Pollutimonas bauzanensis]